MSGHIENLLYECESWSSLHLKVEYLITTIQDGSESTGKAVYDYIETSSGKRFCDMVVEYGSSPSATRRTTGYCDGARCAMVAYQPGDPTKQAEVRIEKGFLNETRYGISERPYPLQFFSVGLTPLHQAFSKGERRGSDRVIGRPCDVYHFKLAANQGAFEDAVYALDSRTSVPLKVEFFTDRLMMEKGAPSARWEAETFDTIGSYHLPKKSKFEIYKRNELPSLKKIMYTTIKVTSFEHNKKIDGRMFWPSLQPGVQVFDSISHKAYNAPGTNESATTTVSPDQFTPVEPPTSWAAKLPSITFGVGIVLIAVALIWRRRTRSQGRPD